MRTRARLRMLADYLAATRNEIAVDEMFLSIAQKNAENVGYLPRVPHWINLAKRYPYLTRSVCYIAQTVWLAGGAIVFFLIEYLWLSYLRRSFGSVALPNANGAILGFSTRVYDVLNPKQFRSFPTTWLTIPWASQKELPDGSEELPMLSILDRKDLLNAFADALTIVYRMRRNRHLSTWILQSYTAFRWFLVRRATDRLAGKLITTEHFDRWAVLADRSVREKRRVSRYNVRLVMVQHGVLGALTQEAICDTQVNSIPTVLTQVNELHAYDENEAAIFQSRVFASKNDTQELDLHLFKPVIKLTGKKISKRIRLLFVGHPLCEAFQASVYDELTKICSVEVFYKPHPKAPMSSSVMGVGWSIVTDKKIFPRVDFLISYPSTLVVEYAVFDIPASVHPLDCGTDFLPIYVERTKKLICDTYF